MTSKTLKKIAPAVYKILVNRPE